MTNFLEIKEKLRDGEIKRLHEITGKSTRMIGYVLDGKRKSDLILRAAHMLITHRELSDSIIKAELFQNEKNK